MDPKLSKVIKQKFGPRAEYTVDSRHFNADTCQFIYLITVDVKGMAVVPAAVISTKVKRGVIWQIYEHTYQALDPK